MIFNALSFFAIAVAVIPNVAATAIQGRGLLAPLIDYPRLGTFWAPRYTHNVTWAAQSGTASLTFVNVQNDNKRFPLKDNVDLSKGRIEIVVPVVEIGEIYQVWLHIISASKSEEYTPPSDSTTSKSGNVEIKDPESIPASSTPTFSSTPTQSSTATPSSIPTVVPTSTPTVVPSTDPTVVPSSTPTVVPSSTPTIVTPSTTTVFTSSTTTIAAPSITTVLTSSTTTIVAPSPSISSVASSVSSVIESISSSLSSAQSSIAASASSALSSLASGASSAVASATSISRSATSATSSVSPSATISAAIGAKGFAHAKLGVFVTTGLVVLSTLAGASLF